MKYDVVIVGGGSDGCTLAARLSEDAGLQIATSGSRADIIGILLLDAREGAVARCFGMGVALCSGRWRTGLLTSSLAMGELWFPQVPIYWSIGRPPVALQRG